jgi:hypothetical protein
MSNRRIVKKSPANPKGRGNSKNQSSQKSRGKDWEDGRVAMSRAG